MDKVYSFQSKSSKSKLHSVMQSDQKLQFYSEDEGEQSNENSPKSQQIQQKSKFGGAANQNGYQTDDSDSNTTVDKNGQSKPKQKMSKFSKLCNNQKINGDVEQVPEYSDEDLKIAEKKQMESQNHNYNIEEQAQKAQQSQKTHPQRPKLQKNKQTLSMQNLNVESDNENVKKNTPQLSKDQLDQHPFRHLIFGSQISESAFKRHLLLTQRGLIYASKCLKGPSDKFIEQKKVILSESNPRKQKILVLDLDETLIHSCSAKEVPQVYITAMGDYGVPAKLGVNIRPYTTLFLQQLSDIYTIYVYTASSQAYANAIISYLDPHKSYISGMMTRNNCMETKNGFFIKDLRLISNRELKDIIIIDNLVHSFGFQIDNGIPILEWHNDMQDQELKYICQYLIEASSCEDLREFNKKNLKLNELMDYKLEE